MSIVWVPDTKQRHETKVILLHHDTKGLNADRVRQNAETILAEHYAQGWRLISILDGLAFMERPMKEVRYHVGSDGKVWERGPQ